MISVHTTQEPCPSNLCQPTQLPCRSNKGGDLVITAMVDNIDHDIQVGSTNGTLVGDGDVNEKEARLFINTARCIPLTEYNATAVQGAACKGCDDLRYI